jgi:hypothetical protein
VSFGNRKREQGKRAMSELFLAADVAFDGPAGGDEEDLRIRPSRSDLLGNGDRWKKMAAAPAGGE